MGSQSLFRSWMGIAFVVVFAAGAAAWGVLPLCEVGAAEQERVPVPKALLRFDDGDSLEIRWPDGAEQVRVLGIDTPEVQHLEHNLPHAQPFGEEAAGFLRGCVAVAGRLELLRSGEKDKYGRTLGYLFLDGKNYSVLVIEARLAYGPNARFGDGGLPTEFAACLAAAAKAGPLAFEEPYKFRRRMRELATWMKENGSYPRLPK